MFRELQRKNRMLSQQECIEILSQEKRGVLSVTGDGDYPYAMPMNQWYNEEDGCIYFHCGKEGHRIDSIRKNNKASFCVYTKGTKKEGQWAYKIKSVIVFGKIDIIENKKEVIEITKKLCRKFTDDEAYIEREIELYADKTLLLRLNVEHLCGKKVTEA